MTRWGAGMIPDEVLRDILARAKQEWPGDRQQQLASLKEEKEAYTRLHSTDFGAPLEVQQRLIEIAKSDFSSWCDILASVQSEVHAYQKIDEFAPEWVCAESLAEWKALAKEKFDSQYEDQLAFLTERAEKEVYIAETRRAVDPIKTLLIELERIVGNECYNGNIQNHGSWGVLEGVGRQFRYPIVFYKESGEEKRWAVPNDIPRETLINSARPALSAGRAEGELEQWS